MRASKMEHTNLLLQGRFEDMAANMEERERLYGLPRSRSDHRLPFHSVASRWLYQFWIFAYKAAKDWSPTSQTWTIFDLELQDLDESSLHPSPGSPLLQYRRDDTQDRSCVSVPLPSQLCDWSIHVDPENYVDPSTETDAEQTIVCDQPRFEDHPRHGLETNQFSTISVEDVPLGVSDVVQAARLSPHEMIRESFSFAIMARNWNLVETLLTRACQEDVNLASVFPLHLATSYLDGAAQCCNILDLLLQYRAYSGLMVYHNDLGHTVLDNLILTVLQSHARDLPGTFGQYLKRESRFSGIEVGHLWTLGCRFAVFASSFGVWQIQYSS